MQTRMLAKAGAALALMVASGAASARSVSVTVGGPSNGDYYVILYRWDDASNRNIAVASQKAALQGASLTVVTKTFKFDNLPAGVYRAQVMRCANGRWLGTSTVYAQWPWSNPSLGSVVFPFE